MNKRSIHLPFTMKKSKNDKSFKIKTQNELKTVSGSAKNESFLNFFKKIIYQNNMNNSNKIIYIKGSDSKKYYEKVKETM